MDSSDASWAALAAGIAAMGAAVFVVSAYRVSPWLIPAAAAAFAFLALTLWRPAWGLAATFLAAPLESLSSSLGASALSPSKVGLMTLGVGWLLRALGGADVRRPQLRDLPIIVLLAVIAVGLARATVVGPLARTAVIWTLFYFAYLQVQTFSAREIRTVLVALALGVGVLGAIGAAQYLSSGRTGLLGGGTITLSRAVGAFSDANYYASFLVLGALPCLALLLSETKRVWLAGAFACAAAGIAFSLSRGAMAGFAFGLLVLLAWRRARWIAVAIGIVFVITTLAGVNPIVKSDKFQTVERRLSTLETVGLSQTTSRPQIWKVALDLTAEHPFVGVGLNQFQVYAAQRNLTERGGVLENAHSIPLSLAAETGLIGLAAFLAWAAQLARRAVVAVRRAGRDAPVALGIAAALAAFGIQGLTVVQLRVTLVAGTFFVLAGMLTAYADREPEVGARLEAPSPVAAP
jgi:O-antigen ligase